MSANDELQAHTCEKVMEFYKKPQHYVKKSHNVANNVAQQNSQDLERVADTSKKNIVLTGFTSVNIVAK